MILKGIVDRIMESGRFLKQTGPSHLWRAISKAEARVEVAQCFQYHKGRLIGQTYSAMSQVSDNDWSSDEEPEDFDAAPEEAVAASNEDTYPNDDVDELAVDPFPHDVAEFHPHAEIEKELGFSLTHQSVPGQLSQPENVKNLHDLGSTEKYNCANFCKDFELTENSHLTRNN